jgi:ketosteroid isomerase-like protein
MTKSASEIAAEMRAVAHDRTKSRELLASLFAENVELRHVPARPSDGPIAGSFLAEVSRREVEALPRALHDVVHDEAEIAVEGDAIRVRGRTSGTLPVGTTIDVRTNTLLTIADGAIVALQSDMDAPSTEAWQKVLVAGGFEVPPRTAAG